MDATDLDEFPDINLNKRLDEDEFPDNLTNDDFF